MSINKVIITGNLTREPDLRQTASGMAVLGFGVAVNERRKNSQTGEWEDFPNYVDCTMFGSRAQGIAPYLAKGGKVAIEGHLRWSQWERDGQKRSKLEVLVDEIELMSQSRSKAANAPQGGTGAENGQMPPETAGNQPQTAYEGDMYDEDIPF